MNKEKNAMITYNGNQITFFSDGINDYINLTEMAKAWKYRKSILTWLRTKQTIEFLNVWEKKYNPQYDGANYSTVLSYVKDLTLTIKKWVDTFWRLAKS